MALNDFIYRLKAMPGDATPHDELGVSADIGTGITAALTDRGAGDVAWRFSAGRTSIAIPANAIDMLTAGTGATMALTVKMVNYGTTVYRAILGVGADQLPEAYASATTAPGMCFSRHGSTTVRAVGVGATYTNNITAATDERTYVIRFSTNKATNYEYLEIWANDPANPGTPAYLSSLATTINSSNNTVFDTLSIDCSTSIIIDVKDWVVWPNEKTDAECAAVAANGIRTSLDTVADTTAPTFSGTMTHNSVTSSSAIVDWSGCTFGDNVGIVGFDTSLDGTVWTDRGLVTSYEFADLPSNTPQTARVRTRDAAGLTSPVLTRAFTTAVFVADTVPPVLTGSLTPLSVTPTTFGAECPEATDNFTVAGYEYSINGGADWQPTEGLERNFLYEDADPGTSYPVQMRAVDGSGLKSTPALALTITTPAMPDAQLVSDIICGNDALPMPSTGGWTVCVQDVATFDKVLTLTNVSTNAASLFIINSALLQRYSYYRLIYQRPDGTTKPPEGMQTVMAA